MPIPDLLRPVAADMRRVDEVLRSSLATDVALIDEVSRHLIAAGGKRMRPALLLLVNRALGGQGDAPCQLAAIIELIHTATLLHDDVVDDTDRRRGRHTANALWGNPAAVLSGDFLYSRSFQMMVRLDSMAVMQVLADATNAIAEGEVLQLMNCGDPEVSEQRYLQVIERKTARLFSAAGELGAIAAGADAETRRRMAEFGLAFGLAFQIVDDLLDYVADPDVSGKNLGTDLAEGKPTLPLIHAMRHGTAEQAALIREAITSGAAASLDRILEAIETAGSLQYTAALAARHADRAAELLGALPDSEYRSALLGLTEFAVRRAH